MDTNYTDINVVQDKSGSMIGLRDDTIGGFNSFLDEQKKAPGKCTFTLTQFDTTFNILYAGEDIQKVEPLTRETYKPGGNTALLDAIARTIITTGQRLEALPEDQRPARVIFGIFTDGMENSSVEYGGEAGHAKVMEMIKNQREKYNWQFMFIGASQDAIQSGSGIGINSATSFSTANNSKGTAAAYAAASSNIRSYRAAAPENTDNLAFTKEQRDEQYQAGAVKDSLAGQP